MGKPSGLMVSGYWPSSVMAMVLSMGKGTGDW